MIKQGGSPIQDFISRIPIEQISRLSISFALISSRMHNHDYPGWSQVWRKHYSWLRPCTSTCMHIRVPRVCVELSFSCILWAPLPRSPDFFSHDYLTRNHSQGGFEGFPLLICTIHMNLYESHTRLIIESRTVKDPPACINSIPSKMHLLRFVPMCWSHTPLCMLGLAWANCKMLHWLHQDIHEPPSQ